MLQNLHREKCTLCEEMHIFRRIDVGAGRLCSFSRRTLKNGSSVAEAEPRYNDRYEDRAPPPPYSQQSSSKAGIPPLFFEKDMHHRKQQNKSNGLCFIHPAFVLDALPCLAPSYGRSSSYAEPAHREPIGPQRGARANEDEGETPQSQHENESQRKSMSSADASSGCAQAGG